MSYRMVDLSIKIHPMNGFHECIESLHVTVLIYAKKEKNKKPLIKTKEIR